jgi:hypothetical protein
MLVDDYSEARLLSLADDIVELDEPSWIEPIVRVHEPERLKVEPDEVEAAASNDAEVAPLEAALADVPPIRVVT